MARIHHINCATMCPRGAKLLAGSGGLLEEAPLVGHVLVVEGDDGLVLVDTGFGTRDVAEPRKLGQPFRALIRPKPDLADTALHQIPALGLDPADVRHIAITHLDVDHAGGLSDFPDATVHVTASELAISKAAPLRERGRYRKHHFEHGPKWKPYDPEAGGESWFGFESIRLLPGSPEVAMIPLPGHSAGHAAIAVRDGDGWLLHCGDAYFNHGEVATPPSCPPGLAFFQRVVCHDNDDRLANQARLVELQREHGDEVRLVCAHDPVELDAFAAAPAG